MVVSQPSTLLPTGGGGRGGFLARAIRLSAITLEPFHLGSPNFLTSLFYALDTCGEISGIKLIFQGGCCSNFSSKGSSKIRGMKIFFLFKMAEICRGYNLG